DKTIHHFQNIGKNTSNSDKTFNGTSLPAFWRSVYYKDPPPDLVNRTSLNSPIFLTELKDIIKQLPCNKATGPSLLSYEMIKHLPDEFLLHILTLFNMILQH